MSQDFLDARDVSTILYDRYKGLIDQATVASALFEKMMSNDCFVYNQGFPAGVQFAISKANSFDSMVQSLGDGEDIQFRNADDEALVTSLYSVLALGLGIPKLYVDRLKNHSDRLQLYKMIDQKANKVEKALIEALCEDLNNDGTQTRPGSLSCMIGLKGIVSATNTYLGINRTTSGNEYWQSQVLNVTSFQTQTVTGVNDGERAMARISMNIELQGARTAGVTPGMSKSREHWDALFGHPYQILDYTQAVNSRVLFNTGEQDQGKNKAKTTFELKPYYSDNHVPNKTTWFIPYSHFKIYSCYSRLFVIAAQDKTNMVNGDAYVGQFVPKIEVPSAFGKFTATNQEQA